jgi:glyoxylase-like metal-dependent hydrolase (beta-lactamase superfamily II)
MCRGGGGYCATVRSIKSGDVMKTKMLAVLAALIAATCAAPASAQRDFSKVVIKTTQLAPNFYALDGDGGTIGVLTGPDGVLMVDSQFAPLSERILAAIKQVSDGRIRYLVNTHLHGDHVGGNENMAKAGAVIFARHNLRARLAKQGIQSNGVPNVPTPPQALPVVTYDAPTVINANGEAVQLIPVPAAHTDGDTMVFFPKANVLMTGDFYRSLGYPNIDRNNGGSIGGMLAGFDAILKLTNADTKIVPGHGAVVDKNAVAAHKDIMVAVRDKLAALVKDGKTLEEALAAKLTADFDAKVPGAADTSARFITQMYSEMKAGK